MNVDVLKLWRELPTSSGSLYECQGSNAARRRITASSRSRIAAHSALLFPVCGARLLRVRLLATSPWQVAALRLTRLGISLLTLLVIRSSVHHHAGAFAAVAACRAADHNLAAAGHL